MTRWWSSAPAPSSGPGTRPTAPPSARITLPTWRSRRARVLAFKLAVRHPGGKVTWAQGGNHYLLVPEHGTAAATVAW